MHARAVHLVADDAERGARVRLQGCSAHSTSTRGRSEPGTPQAPSQHVEIGDVTYESSERYR